MSIEFYSHCPRCGQNLFVDGDGCSKCGWPKAPTESKAEGGADEITGIASHMMGLEPTTADSYGGIPRSAEPPQPSVQPHTFYCDNPGCLGKHTNESKLCNCFSRKLPGSESNKSVEPSVQRMAPLELCQNCHQSNPVWFAPNLVWNSVVTEISGILCPMCFIARAERQGFECTGWQLVPETVQQLAELPSVQGQQGDEYTKLPVSIRATQWFANGDHPEDACVELRDSEGEAYLSEGKIVRYFRRPGVSGISKCRHCGLTMYVHGWIDTKEGGHIVCPGDFIITGVAGEHYPCKPDIFAKTYVKGKSSAPSITSERIEQLAQEALEPTKFRVYRSDLIEFAKKALREAGVRVG